MPLSQAYSIDRARRRPTYPSRAFLAESRPERRHSGRLSRRARASPDAGRDSRSSSARRCNPARRQTATRSMRAGYPQNDTRPLRWRARRADRRRRAGWPRPARFAAGRGGAAFRGWTRAI